MPNQRSGRSLPAPQAAVPVSAPSEPVGIIGSVKVLAIESENAHLQRELNKARRQLEDQQKCMEKYKRLQDLNLSEERALKSLPNGASPAKLPAANLKTKLVHATAEATNGVTGATAGATKGATAATAHEDPYAASLDITTASGVLLEDDPYVALLGTGNNVIRDLYEPLFRDEYKKPAAKEEIEPCTQQ